jgi:hypothetical protein
MFIVMFQNWLKIFIDKQNNILAEPSFLQQPDNWVAMKIWKKVGRLRSKQNKTLISIIFKI